MWGGSSNTSCEGLANKKTITNVWDKSFDLFSSVPTFCPRSLFGSQTPSFNVDAAKTERRTKKQKNFFCKNCFKNLFLASLTVVRIII